MPVFLKIRTHKQLQGGSLCAKSKKPYPFPWTGKPRTSGFSGGGLLDTITRASTGGRFSGPTVTEIAEDGDPEYVIPVKKESIAVPLLLQLMGELSSSAREALRGDALSGLPDLLSSAPAAAAPVVTQNMNSSVQAMGRSIYDMAERYLLRTLQSI